MFLEWARTREYKIKNVVKPQANIDSLKVMISSFLKILLIEIQSWLYVDFYENICVFYSQNVQKIQTGEV